MGRVWIAVALVVAVTGCGRIADSRINPFNWFGGSSPAPVIAIDEGMEVDDSRPLIAVIETLTISQMPAGAIVRATGIASVQGYYDGELVPIETADPGVLAYAFRAVPPATPTRVSTERSREVTVAVQLTNRELAGIREIRVTAAQNARAARR